MRLPHAIVIAAALIASAIIVHDAFSQATTTPYMTGVVVTACGTPPSFPSGTGFAYTAGSQAPFTMDTTGKICNNI